jgi:hypothetical protein
MGRQVSLGGSSPRASHAHYDSPDATRSAGDRPRAEVESTEHSTEYPRDLLNDARETLELWIRNASQERWIDASRAAVTLRSRARQRKVRGRSARRDAI